MNGWIDIWIGESAFNTYCIFALIQYWSKDLLITWDTIYSCDESAIKFSRCKITGKYMANLEL